MTTEEKAKAYDKALERAKSFELPEYKNIMASIFPELRENEDEKIRKELITHCRNTRCVTEEGAERIAKWIAWLERQPKWTEEDEELLQHCCGAVAAADYYTLEDKEEMENWLNSLKQRNL